MKRKGMTLRQLCRAVELDPSFFSKVLSGKRSPPMEEKTLRRIAEELSLDAAELVVAAGRIPQEWAGVWTDPELFRRVHSVATRTPVAPAPRTSSPKIAAPMPVPAKRSLGEELL